MPGIDTFALLGAGPWLTTDAASLKHACQRARFDAMAVVSAQAISGDCAAGNAQVKALLDAEPRMYGWVVITPSHVDESIEEMRRYLTGQRWLGALLVLPSSRDSLLSSTSRELINAYRRYARPMLLRIPDDVAVRELETIASEFPTIKFVAGGAGGASWASCMVAARQRPNIFLEPFSGEPHRGKLERILQVLGPHRLIFASNFPRQNPGAAIGLLSEAQITDAEKQSILATSAARLFNLTQS